MTRRERDEANLDKLLDATKRIAELESLANSRSKMGSSTTLLENLTWGLDCRDANLDKLLDATKRIAELEAVVKAAILMRHEAERLREDVTISFDLPDNGELVAQRLDDFAVARNKFDDARGAK